MTSKRISDEAVPEPYRSVIHDCKGPISEWGEVFATRAKELAEETDSKITAIGHSAGGVIIRSGTQMHGADEYVEREILTATPNNGTYPWQLAYLELFRPMLEHRFPMVTDLLPGSDFMNELNGLPLPSDTDVVNIYGTSDPLVSDESAHLDGALNVKLKGVGRLHFDLLFNKGVFDEAYKHMNPESPKLYVPGLYHLPIVAAAPYLGPLLAHDISYVFDKPLARDCFQMMHNDFQRRNGLKAA